MRKHFAIMVVALASCPGALAADTVETATSAPKCNYARPFPSKAQPAFATLPAGTVEPSGWLRDWCIAARDGFTGHMDEYDQAFRNAWAADYKMTGENLNEWSKGSWPYEGGGYWFDGMVRLGYALHDEGLIAQARRRFGVVVDHMDADGTLFLWWIKKSNLEDAKRLGAWPVWACGLFGRAMAGYYEACKAPEVLRSLELAYGGNGDRISAGWSMSNVWPAFDTYTWSGNKDIAAALTALFSQASGASDRYRRMPATGSGANSNDHVVHFLETTTPWAVGYLWTGKREYLDVALAWHDFLERVAMQPQGVPVADEWYGPTGAYRGTETCDVAGYIWSQSCLLSVTGEARFADRMERAFFNAGPATVARDFRTHVYFQCPNRFADRSPDYPHGPRAGGGSYARTHSPLCCTAALNRIVPYYITHMWMATGDGGLAATCHGPCTVKALAAEHVPVEITCRTEYPFGETIDMAVEPAKEAAFPLWLHVPEWCAGPELQLNGNAMKAAVRPDGFIRIDRTWRSGDSLRFRLPMSVRIEKGRDITEPGPRDGRHRAVAISIPEKPGTKGAPYASVSYGPLLFVLPIADVPNENTPDPSSRWSYALDSRASDIRVDRQAMPSKWDWPLQSPIRLRARGTAIDWKPRPEAPSLPPDVFGANGDPAELSLVPYGCTKFRISMFPVTARIWEE